MEIDLKYQKRNEIKYSHSKLINITFHINNFSFIIVIITIKIHFNLIKI